MKDFEKLLVKAVENNNLEELDSALELYETYLSEDFTEDDPIENFVGINFLDEVSGKGLLHIAAEKNYIDIINILLTVNDINLNLLSRDKTLPINVAISKFSREVALRLLQDKEININQEDEIPIILLNAGQVLTNKEIQYYNQSNCYILRSGGTPFFYAANHGEFTIMNEILKKENIQIEKLLATTFLYAQTNLSHFENKEEQEKDASPTINLLFTLGAGIGCVIWSPEFIYFPGFDTTDKIVIGKIRPSSKENDDCIIIKNHFVRITRKTPGFEKAITSVAECKEAINNNKLPADIKSLIKMCDAHRNPDPKIQEEIKQIKWLLEYLKPKTTLKNQCLNWFNDYKNRTYITQHINHKNIPLELQEKIELFKPKPT